MDCDFSMLCADQIEKLENRLESLHKSFIKDYQLALNVINNDEEQKNRSETITEIEDLFRDQLKKSQIFYTETLNKVQRELIKHLK